MFLFYQIDRQLEFQRMELCQANQLTDQAERAWSWPFGELDLRNSAFQEDRA